MAHGDVQKFARQVSWILLIQRQVLTQLCNELDAKSYMTNSQYISDYEQVTMFLLTIWQNCRKLFVQHVFQHFGEMLSHHFHLVLHSLAAFAKAMIIPPSFNETPPEILKNMKYYP